MTVYRVPTLVGLFVARQLRMTVYRVPTLVGLFVATQLRMTVYRVPTSVGLFVAIQLRMTVYRVPTSVGLFVAIQLRITAYRVPTSVGLLVRWRKARLKSVLYTPLVHVPFLTVVKNRILTPNLRSSLMAYSLDKIGRAGPRPILPFLYIAMMHWIVMNIVYTGPEMAM